MVKKKSQDELGREVLDLGSRVIEAFKGEDPQVPDLVEEYSIVFERWKESWPASGLLSQRNKEMVERISTQHDTIIEATETIIESVEQSLKDIRSWSKGIRAYIGNQPKKLSAGRSRKG